MTHEELDRLWFEAMEQSIRDGEQVVRYHFAALVAAAKAAEHQQTLALQQRSYEREIEIEVEAEREACAKVCEAEGQRIDASWVSCAAAIRERSNT